MTEKSKQPKPPRACDMWFIVDPSGSIDRFSSAYQKAGCIERWCDRRNYLRHSWPELRREGYRCVKCRVEPVE